jgi:hypothetical protein
LSLVTSTMELNDAISLQHRRRTHRLRASSREMYKLEVQRSDGLPVIMTCNSNSTSSAQAAAKMHRLNATIEFDYEFAVIDPGEDVVEVMKQDLPYLEFFILYYVAEQTGVLKCDLASQDVFLFGDKSLISATQADARPKADVVSLSSVATDTRDLTVGECR